MKGLVIRLRTLLVRTGFAIGQRRPIRARVVLATTHADHLGGNLLYIHRELARRTPPIEVIVLASRASPGMRGRI